MIRRKFPMSSCSRPSGRTTIPPRACARATTWARSIAPESTHSPASSAASGRGALSKDWVLSRVSLSPQAGRGSVPRPRRLPGLYYRSSSLAHVLLEKIHGALPGCFGARFVETAALIAMETVPRAGVDVDLRVAAALALDYLDIGH